MDKNGRRSRQTSPSLVKDPNWGIGRMRVTTRPNGTLHVSYDGRVDSPRAAVPHASSAGSVSRNNTAPEPARKSSSSLRKQATPPSPQISPVTVRPFRLAHPDEFKRPDDWVSLGGATTLSATGNTYDVYLGIDFGTAYTKASIGFGGDVFIVDWEGVKAGEERFTLPGEFSVLRDRSCILGRSRDAARVASDLKLPFLEGNASNATLIDTTVFLALIMRYVRAWWFYRHQGIIQNRSLKWHVNLGAPTTPWHDNEVRRKYEDAAKAAWMISLGMAPISPDQAEHALLGRLKGFKDESLPHIEIVPEFVAQIASYTRSPQRQHDLHLLIDVGAGTVDVVTFNVHRDDQSGEDRFPIFSAAVKNLGTHYLMSRRLQSCLVERQGSWDDASSVPSAVKFSEVSGMRLEEVQCADEAHTTDVASAISSVLRRTRMKRYRRSPNWTGGIRVFLCGGGSSCDTFVPSLSVAASQAGVPLSPIRLPLPERLKAQNLSPEQFHRVSVAFGLGMDVFNLGQIVSMAEVEDDKASSLPLREHFDWDEG